MRSVSVLCTATSTVIVEFEKQLSTDSAACCTYTTGLLQIFIYISKESDRVCPRWPAMTATMHRSSSRDTDSFISLHDPGHSHLGLTPSAADSELGQLAYSSLSGPLLPAVLLSRTPDCALQYFSHLQKHLEMRLFLASARDKNSL